MFELFVVGPVAAVAGGLGLARRCIACQAVRRNPAACPGFGEGCLALPKPAPAPGPPAQTPIS